MLLRNRLLAGAFALALSACATPNLGREAALSGDLMTGKVAPMDDINKIEGVWVDTGGTALLWVKIVDGEARGFIQDSLPRGVIDTMVLIDAVDNGDKARKLARDWPYRGEASEDKGAGLSYVFAVRVPETKGEAALGANGPWATAHYCHGKPRPGTYETTVSLGYTNKKLALLNVLLTQGKEKVIDEYVRTYQFTKLEQPIEPRMVQDLSDNANFCRRE